MSNLSDTELIQYLSFDGSNDSLEANLAGHILDDPSGQNVTIDSNNVIAAQFQDVKIKTMCISFQKRILQKIISLLIQSCINGIVKISNITYETHR